MLRIQRIFFFLLLMSLVGSLQAQEEGWLYRMEGPNIRSSYLVGVLPSTSPLTYQWNDSVYAAIAQSEVIAVDAVLDSLQRAEYASLSTMPGGQTFNDWLNNAKFAAINEHLQHLDKGSLWQFTTYYPLYMAAQLQSWSLQQQQSGLAFLLRLAEVQQKRVIGLFEGDAVTGLLSAIPGRLQSDLLLAFTESWFSETFRQRLVRHYLSGDKELLQQFIARELPIEYQAFFQQGLINLLVREVPTQARRQPTAFLVDATLLGGENGLVSALREQGITLTPIGDGLELVSTQDPTPVEEADTIVFEADPDIEYYRLNEEYRQQYFDEIIANWHTLTSYRGAFTIRMPDRPEEIMEQLPVEEGNVTVRLYKFEDRALNIFYLVSFYDYPDWYALEEQPGFFRQVISRSVNRFGGILLLERDISNAQFRGKEIEIQVDEDYTIRVRFYLVGNRMYQVALGATGRKAYSKQNEAFLRSFRILDQRMAGWTPVDLGFAEVELPGRPTRETGIITIDSMPAHYFAYLKKDPTTLLQYATTVTYLPPGYRLRKEEPVYRRMIYETARQLNAVLIRQEDFTRGELDGQYIELGSGADTVIRMVVLYHDHRLLQLMVMGPEDSAFSAFADHFFDSFSVSAYEY